MKPLRIAVALSLGLSLALAAVPAGAAGPKDADKCPVCGIVAGAAKFVVVHGNGKKQTYACPRCAFQDADMRQVRSATATDFMSRRTVDARKAFYLKNTGYGECCGPYWLSFAVREDAERFAKGFGGKVLDYEEALQFFPPKPK